NALGVLAERAALADILEPVKAARKRAAPCAHGRPCGRPAAVLGRPARRTNAGRFDPGGAAPRPPALPRRSAQRISSAGHRGGCPRTPARVKAKPLRGRLRRALTAAGNLGQGQACPTEEI